MKKNRFAEFFKGKGYYVLLFVGVIAIAAVAIIGSNLATKEDDKGEDYVDLNEQDNNIAADDNDDMLADNNDMPDQTANNEQAGGQQSGEGDEQTTADNDSLLEHDIYTQEEENGIDLVEVVTPTAAPKKEEKPAAVETTGKTVKSEKTPTRDQLKFQIDKGLLWPVDGNVIMNYSMQHTIYYATLMQYKCNPAIIIDAEVGTEVKAAADGIISSISTNEETGLTIAMDIGDGYKLIYGQLDDVSLDVGDWVEEGDIIGVISEPTKYYLVEGSNLYFSVMQNDQTVDPMLYLR